MGHMFIVDNRSRKLRRVLSQAIGACEDARMAVAFASREGVELLEAAIDSAIARGAYMEFLLGLDLAYTEPEALSSLYQRARRWPNVELYCYASFDRHSIYHPKMYLFRCPGKVTSVVGSSNLTRGGLGRNAEVNVVIETSPSDELVSDLYSAYNRLKFDPKRVVPDEELLDYYAGLYQRQRRAKPGQPSDSQAAELLARLKAKASTLARPKPSERDLVGWLQLVYSTLPDGEFETSWVYQYAELFHSEYPENRNVREKVRQQLQRLRDMGLLEHVRRGHWRKV